MALARALDERAWILNRSGRVHFVISGQGHEGAEAGITAALTPGRDWFLPYYRSMTGVMAMGMTPRELFLHQFGKADDPGSGGRQMPSHYGHARHRIFTSSSPVGTQILHAAGIALAAKLRGLPEVALVAMGEGSSNQGDVHEALNFAGVHRLPMILLVENNGYAISVPAERQTAVRDIAVRAAGYAMPGVIVDGADVIGCYLAARDAVARAMAGEGPTLIEAKVTRLTGHSSDDQQTKYRSAEELAEQRQQDPLPRFRDELREAGLLDEVAEAAIAADVAAAVDDATDFAEASPDPDPGALLLHVYAEPGDPAPGPPPASPPASNPGGPA
jgi:2-oxoisovalerate dehydrogenase E1 component alpha subunit